ncbi:hypothetical protein PoB_002387400 [Plakobranchus ocellatus]|uniref:Uncharacterized protein n=1 Tax=Plakobranchus ocellatus TaxID=259542 RepID=A0AAV3ZSJ0_9GAST|nr:hypothetical protein PoB_002387400 [Plakobranchus ocellatus]
MCPRTTIVHKDKEVGRKEGGGWGKLTQLDRSRRTRIVANRRRGAYLECWCFVPDEESAVVDIPDGDSDVITLKFRPVRTKDRRKGQISQEKEIG